MDNKKANLKLFEWGRLLLNIIHKHKNIVENKKTDAITNDEKAKIWETIAEEFNASSPEIARNVTSLKKYYFNKKKEVRKVAAEERFQTTVTGGGPKSDPTATCKDYDLMLSIVNNKTIFGLPNEFDSNMPVASTSKFNDNEFLSEEDVVFMDETNENEALHENVDESVEVQPLNWGKYKPAMLQTPLHPALNNLRSGTEKTPNHSRRRSATIVKSLTKEIPHNGGL